MLKKQKKRNSEQVVADIINRGYSLPMVDIIAQPNLGYRTFYNDDALYDVGAESQRLARYANDIYPRVYNSDLILDRYFNNEPTSWRSYKYGGRPEFAIGGHPTSRAPWSIRGSVTPRRSLSNPSTNAPWTNTPNNPAAPRAPFRQPQPTRPVTSNPPAKVNLYNTNGLDPNYKRFIKGVGKAASWLPYIMGAISQTPDMRTYDYDDEGYQVDLYTGERLKNDWNRREIREKTKKTYDSMVDYAKGLYAKNHPQSKKSTPKTTSAQKQQAKSITTPADTTKRTVNAPVTQQADSATTGRNKYAVSPFGRKNNSAKTTQPSTPTVQPDTLVNQQDSAAVKQNTPVASTNTQPTNTATSNSTTSANTPSTSTNGKVHTVKKGDNLWTIAKNNGITLNTLYRLNPGIDNRKYIYPGDKINLTDTAVGNQTTYNVKRGNSPWQIAHDHGISLDEFYEANPSVKKHGLYPNDVVVIPSRSKKKYGGGVRRRLESNGSATL